MNLIFTLTKKEELILSKNNKVQTGKFRVVLMLLFICMVSYNSIAQNTKISLNFSNISIKEVFKEIEKQSQYSIFYSDELIKNIVVKNLNSKGETALVILDKLLPQYNLKYELNNNIIVILQATDKKTKSPEKRKVTGKVSGSDGLTIPGVNVFLKGSNEGTITNINGEFSLEVPDQKSTLVFSFIGFIRQEVQVGNSDFLDILLKEEIVELDGVVVTALGITKEKKALGYSVSYLKGNELTTVKDPNIMNSLAGKSAGVQISKTAGGPDASTRVIIRGINSLQGNNQPLFVVDGIPMNNNNFGQTTASAEGNDVGQGFELGSGIGDLNPEDIESVSILKGPNASALYGSRAANGVIIFTTKKGTKKTGLGITFSTNTTADKAIHDRTYQDVYGFGNNGISPVNADGIKQFQDQTEGSWGSAMDGQPFIDWDGVTRNYDPQPDNYKDFFQTGYTSTNTIAVAGGTDKSVYRLSYTNLSNKGISPNNKFGRNTFNLSAGTELGPKLKIDTKVTYITHEAKNRNFQADGHSVSRNYIHMSRHISDASLQNYENEDGTENVWRNNDRQSNPYWVAYKNFNGDKRDRIMGNTSVTYNFNSWLSLMGRIGLDMYNSKTKQITATGALTRLGTDGQLYEATQFSKEINSDFLFSAHKSVSKKISVSGTFGGSNYYQKYESFSGRVTRSSTPNFYNIQYSKDNTIAWTYFQEKKTQSLYGTAQIEYNKYLYLDVTARNDWSSSLPVKNNSYFYPSITGSYVFSESFDLNDKVISFGKVRASWAKVGNDTDPYRLASVFNSAGSYNGQPLVTISTGLPAVDLMPETTISYEIGTELRFFLDRLGFDITLYKSTTSNQILNAGIATSSGFRNALINAGEIANKGIEIQINAEPVRLSNGLSWNIIFNYAKNLSEVVSLTQGLNSLVLANHWNLTVEANPGEPYGNLVGVQIKRDANGNKVIGADGRYIRGERAVLGNYNPDWIGGITNSLKYKRVTFSCQVDMKMGGEIYSATNHYGMEKGTFIETLEGRAEWYASEVARKAAGVSSAQWTPTGGIIAEGVLEDGSVNTKFMNPETYFAQYATWTKEIHEPYIYDATYIKLREVYLSYKLPEKLVNRIKLNNAEVALTGHNLWTIYKKTPNIDPESVYNSTNAQGVEYAALPSVRNIGIYVKVEF